MKYKHKWRLLNLNWGYQVVDDDRSRGNMVVAGMGDTEDGPHRTELCTERANLVVAAPDLLEACKSALVYIESLRYLLESENPQINWDNVLEQRLKDAVVKAKGEREEA